MNEVLLSVIVPCYNVEDYINRCVKSLISVRESNIEFIFIDDGSTDRTYINLSSYKDSRMSIYKKINQGPGATRNYGIKLAKGKYLMFVDADDYIYPEEFEKVIVFLHDDYDLLCLKYTRAEISNKGTLNICSIEAQKISAGLLNIDKKYMKNLMEEGYHFHGPWVKCYKKNIIDENHIAFPNKLRWGEDICFNLAYLEYVKEVYLLPLVIYYYMQNDKSLVKSYKANKGSQMVQLVKEVWKYVKTPELEDAYAYFAARQFLYILQEDLCNCFNKTKYRSRRKKAWYLLNNNSYFNKAIKNCDIKKMGMKPGILVWLVRNKLFLILNILFYFNQRIKMYLKK